MFTITEPNYVGFCVSKFSKNITVCVYDKTLPYFGEDNVDLHYLDKDSFIFYILIPIKA